MTNQTFRTDHTYHDGTGQECNVSLMITYAHHAGYKGDRIDPLEPASIEIISITPEPPGIDLDVIEEEYWEHWQGVEIDAAEYRAEQRANMLRNW